MACLAGTGALSRARLRRQIVRNLPSAGVAELVDALDLGSSGESRGGSSPSARTMRSARLEFCGFACIPTRPAR